MLIIKWTGQSGTIVKVFLTILDGNEEKVLRFFGVQKRKKAILPDGLFTCLMPGSSLLSHGETPHYHRRYGVSLLSSAWG
ncbi:hypothetical protein ACIQCX_20920, partial [Enterobacter cancerogenus]|uniref:hypothetical protein n=1 Tax=Enterobacter cancerogenus TaxID=69218 RepID=UPI003822BA4D